MFMLAMLMLCDASADVLHDYADAQAVAITENRPLLISVNGVKLDRGTGAVLTEAEVLWGDRTSRIVLATVHDGRMIWAGDFKVCPSVDEIAKAVEAERRKWTPRITVVPGPPLSFDLTPRYQPAYSPATQYVAPQYSPSFTQPFSFGRSAAPT